MTPMHWISFVVVFWMDYAFGECVCGEGGLCDVYDPELRQEMSAEPCSCEEVSKGIFVSEKTKCNEIVNHCETENCSLNGLCSFGLGSFYCRCAIGWEGQRCSIRINPREVGKVFMLWYTVPFESNEVVEVVIAARNMNNRNQLKIEFKDGRTISLRIVHQCKSVRFDYFSDKYNGYLRHSGVWWILSQFKKRLTIRLSRVSFFICPIPWVTSSELNVYIRKVPGPVGRYEDVKFTILEQNLVQFTSVNRLFQKSIRFLMECPFQLEFSGCGPTKKVAAHYTLFDRITLTVSMVFANGESPQCKVKERVYYWSATGLRNSGDPTLIGQGNQSVTFFPTSDYSRLGMAVVYAQIIVKDSSSRFNGETVRGMCFISLNKGPFVVSIYHGNRRVKCDFPVTVVLESLIVRTQIPRNELEYEWICPMDLCRKSILNRKNLVMNVNLPCDTEYKVELRVHHSKLKSEARHSCKLNFVRDPYNIFLSCEPDCEHANPRTPLTLVAEEDNTSERSVFQWKSIAGTDWFDTTCKSVSTSNISLIKTNTLSPGGTVTFIVSTPKGAHNIMIKGANLPTDFDCDITPTIGIAYVDKFNITCNAETTFQPVTYWVQEGSKNELIMISTSGEIKGLQLTSTPIQVNVTDTTGASTVKYIMVTLEQPSDNEIRKILHEIPSRIDQLYSLLHEKAYNNLVDMVDSMSKLTRFSFPFTWKLRLVELLLRVEQCDWAECVIKRANAIKRFTSTEVQNNTQGVDDFILKASGALYGLIKSLSSLTLDLETSAAHEVVPILTSIYDAVSQCMDFVDPVLYYQFVDEDVRQLHFRKVQEGNTYARRALTELAFFVASHIPAPTSIFELKISEPKGGRTQATTVISHTLEFINCALALNQSRSYTQLNIDKLQHLKAPKVYPAVAITHYDQKNFWWGQKEGIKAGSQMFEVHLFKRRGLQFGWSSERISGPVRTYIRYSYEKQATTITGVDGPTGNSTDSVRVHRMFVPRGHGTLFLVFPTSLMNLINLSISHDRSMFIPKHMNATLSTTKILHNFYFTENQNLYIAVLPLENHTSYSFNYTIIRCVTWSEEMWKSESCKLLELKENFMVCECRHLSLVNAETLAPDNSLVPWNDIELFTDTSAKYYALVILCVLLCFYFGLCVLGRRLHRRGKSSKNAIFLHDNYPGDNCPYLVAVFTGGRCFSGTSAHVALRLLGEKRVSRVHILTSKVKPLLSQGEDSWFILFTSKRLKKISGIELWHDRCGVSHGWYCRKVVVWELENDEMFEFFVDSWINASTLYERGGTTFSIESDTGGRNIKRALAFEYMEAFFRQGHNWASVLVLHPRNRNSRLERAAILTAFVLVTIVTCMLFYMSTGGTVDEPSVTYAKPDFVVSIKSAAISSSVSLFLSVIFRLGKNRMRTEDWVLAGPKTFLDDIRIYFYRLVTYIPVTTIDEHLSYNKVGLLLLGYVTCGAIIVYCIVVIIYVGSSFGLNRSMKWLISSTFALLIEALILNPLMIVAIALLVAYCIRISPNQFVSITVEANADSYPFQKVQERLNKARHERVKPMYKPPLWLDVMEKANPSGRRSGVNRLESLTIILLLASVFIIICTLNDVLPHHRNWLLGEIFKGGKPEESYLDSVLNRTRYFDHLRGTVMPSLHRLNWYNGRPLPIERNEPEFHLNITRPTREYRGYCADYSSKLLGVPQLRQQRVAIDKQKRIDTVFQDKFIRAYGQLSMHNQDTKVYLPKWRTPLEDEVYYKTMSHKTATETGIGWYFGPTRLQYPGSGYVELLHWSLGYSLSALVDLQLDGWLDTMTRSVFLTFNLYDINIGNMASVTIITESLPSGVYASRFVVDSMAVSVSRLPHKKIELGSAMAIAALLTFHIIRLALLISRDGPRKVVFSLPGMVNVVMAVSGICFFALFAVNFVVVLESLERMGSIFRNEYTPLFHMFETNNTLLVFFGVFCAMTSAYAAILTHRLFGFEGFERALDSTWLLILVSFILLTVLTLYSAVTLYFFDVVILSHLSFINFLRNMIALESEYFTSLETHELSLVVFFVMLVLVRLNAGVIILIYFEAAERVRNNRLHSIHPLKFKIHSSSSRRYRRWALIRQFYSPPRQNRPLSVKKMGTLVDVSTHQQRSHSIFSVLTARSARSSSLKSTSEL